jgi:hypothetical protein
MYLYTPSCDLTVHPWKEPKGVSCLLCEWWIAGPLFPAYQPHSGSWVRIFNPYFETGCSKWINVLIHSFIMPQLLIGFLLYLSVLVFSLVSLTTSCLCSYFPPGPLSDTYSEGTRFAISAVLTQGLAVCVLRSNNSLTLDKLIVTSLVNFPSFMKPECSLPCSQQPATCHYPELDAYNQHIPHLTSLRSIIILSFPSASRSSEWFLPFRFCNQNSACISHLFHACYMPRPSHPPWLDHPNNMKFLIMQCSPTSRHWLLVNFPWTPQWHFLRNSVISSYISSLYIVLSYIVFR